MKQVILKSKYQTKELIQEDIISFCYQGELKYLNQNVLIWEYKAEYLSSTLVTRLINVCEKLIAFNHKNLFKMIDYYYDGEVFYTIHESSESFISLDTFLKTQQQMELTKLWKYSTSVLNMLLEIEQAHLYAGTVNFSDLIVTEGSVIKFTRLMIPIEIYKANWNEFEVIEDCIFMAPEFIQTQRFSSRCDMYSYGVLLYVFFSQKWPYKYTIKLDQISKEIISGFQEFKPVHPKIPDRLCNIIHICMKPDPENRFRSFIELIKMYKNNVPVTIDNNQKSPLVLSMKTHLKHKFMKSVFSVIKITFMIIFFMILFLGGRFLFTSYMTSIPEVAVPNLMGLTQEEAERVVMEYNLKAHNAGIRFHPKIEEGLVIETKPPAGRVVKENRVIRMYFSKGVGPILVPDLIGYTKEDVHEKFYNSGILTEVVSEKYSLQYPVGTIIGQYPIANSFLNPSSNVNLIISKGYPISVDIQKVKSSFFQDKSNVRKVDIKLFILEEWGDQEIVIFYSYDNKREKIYSDLLTRSDNLKLEFELEYQGFIEIFFNDQRIIRKKIEENQFNYDDSTF